MKKKKSISRRQQAHRSQQRRERQQIKDLHSLHHQLQDLVTLPPEEEELPKLRAMVTTLLKQRDDALQALSDRANISMTVQRLSSHAFALRTATEEIIASSKLLQEENAVLRFDLVKENQ